MPVVAILGVGQGLGASLSKKFAQEGYKVAMMSRNLGKLKPLEQEIEKAGGKSISISTDFIDENSIVNAFKEVVDKLGGLDVFIHNVGAYRREDIMSISPQEFFDFWKVQCYTAFVSAQEALKIMLPKKSGTIIFTGANLSLQGRAGYSLLTVGRFGTRALAQGLAREFGPMGIHVVHTVIGGVINSPRAKGIFRNLSQDEFMNAEDISETYLHIVKQDKSAWTHEIDINPYTGAL